MKLKKMKRVITVGLTIAMMLSLGGCKSTETTNSDNGAKVTKEASNTNEEKTTPEPTKEPESDELTLPTLDQIKVGEDYLDITASLKVLTHRTDVVDTKLAEYIKEFNKLYPNITITYEGVTDYAQDSLVRLTGGNWGDIMMIPQVDKDELGKFFIPYGSLSTLDTLYNFVNAWTFEDKVYGIPSTANAQGIVYNKKVFEAAGVTELPKTPGDFIAALQKIKDNTDAIPLYTNYAAGWTLGAWDAYLAGSATGDSKYMNQVFLHTKDPFANQGDGTHAYEVYKILYDAAANKLIEDDYTTTDWEGCKAMINNGQIGTMVLGSWAFSQMQDGGPNPDDIGYMSFPITVNGKQYASAGADYSYGINADASLENQVASMVYVKWLTEESGYAYGEGGIPIDKDGEYPELYSAFGNIEFVSDELAVAGEETLLNELNSESGLGINAGGNAKVQAIVEHGFNGTKSFDDIMAEWNLDWSDAQEALGVTVN